MLKKVTPDFIFVQYEDDTHQDHRSLAKATISATRYVRNVLFYEGPTTQNFSPTVFVDIKETIDTKFAMLLAHQSQVQKTNIEGLSITDIVRSTAVFRGIQGRVQFAEAFVPLRLFINIAENCIMIPHSRPTLDQEEADAVARVLHIRAGCAGRGGPAASRRPWPR